jgi:hypothetical protein
MLKELDASCTEYTGKLLFVQVHYGWGWQGAFSENDIEAYKPVEAPPDFHLRVSHFFHWQNALRGAVARIEESGHTYDGYWVVFYTRPQGTYNLTDNITHYNLGIGPDEPLMLDPSEDPEIAEYWPLWKLGGVPQMAGFGMIATTPQNIDKWDKDHTLRPGQAHSLKSR